MNEYPVNPTLEAACKDDHAWFYTHASISPMFQSWVNTLINQSTPVNGTITTVMAGSGPSSSGVRGRVVRKVLAYLQRSIGKPDSSLRRAARGCWTPRRFSSPFLKMALCTSVSVFGIGMYISSTELAPGTCLGQAVMPRMLGSSVVCPSHVWLPSGTN